MLVLIPSAFKISYFNFFNENCRVLNRGYKLNFFLNSGKLAPASGFQSMQFRLLENKLGVKKACVLLFLYAPSYQVFQGDICI